MAAIAQTLIELANDAQNIPQNIPRILALDLSLRSTGWCAGSRVGTIDPRDRRGIRRIAYVRTEVRALVQLFIASVVLIEGYAFSAHASHAHELGELGGVIRMSLDDLDIPFVDVPPASLKLFATGKGNANKEAMLAAAIRKLDYQGHSNDEVDALWLFEMARMHYTTGPVTEAQRKALAKIQWPTLEGR